MCAANVPSLHALTSDHAGPSATVVELEPDPLPPLTVAIPSSFSEWENIWRLEEANYREADAGDPMFAAMAGWIGHLRHLLVVLKQAQATGKPGRVSMAREFMDAIWSANQKLMFGVGDADAALAFAHRRTRVLTEFLAADDTDWPTQEAGRRQIIDGAEELYQCDSPMRGMQLLTAFEALPWQACFPHRPPGGTAPACPERCGVSRHSALR